MSMLFVYRVLSQAYHRYALNYINALNYLETLRRQQEFCDFEKVRNKADLKTTKTFVDLKSNFSLFPRLSHNF